MNHLNEIRGSSYENTKIYKARSGVRSDKKILPREFKVNDQVLLFNSRLKLFPGKLRSRWSGPFRIKEVKPYGAVVLWDVNGEHFTVNGQRLKPYLADESMPSKGKLTICLAFLTTTCSSSLSSLTTSSSSFPLLSIM